LREVLAEAAYERCYVHFLRNALDYVPRRVDDDCLQELRWLYGAPQRGDQTPDSRRAHLPQWRELFALLRALAVETHENWLEQHRYLNMDDLREHKKEALRRAA
jgi:putative transposase